MLEVLTFVVVVGVAGVIISKCNKGKKEKTQDGVSYTVDTDHKCNCSSCSGNCSCHKINDDDGYKINDDIDELDGCGDAGNEFDAGVEDTLEINDEDEYEAEYKINDDIDELQL